MTKTKRVRMMKTKRVTMMKVNLMVWMASMMIAEFVLFDRQQATQWLLSSGY